MITEFNIQKWNWHPQLMPPPLNKTDVHVWLAPSHQIFSRYAFWEQILSTAEQERASRMLLPAARTQFVVGRGLLREILSCYLADAPTALCFDYGLYGKPRLQDENNLRFNLSHTADLIVVAVCRNYEVGIDTEKIRSVDEKKLAAQFLTEAETDWLAASPAADRTANFFQMWTAKESFLKACGVTLASLKSLELPTPLTSPAIVKANNLSTTCNLFKIDTISGYANTLAIALTNDLA